MAIDMEIYHKQDTVPFINNMNAVTIKEPGSFNVTMLRKRRQNDGIVNVVLLCVSGFRFFICYLFSVCCVR